jgi:hypothetical protein
MVENNVIPSVANKIYDEHGNTWASLRSLSNDIQVPRTRISKSLKKNGFFKYNNNTYFLKNTPSVRISIKQEKSNNLPNDEKTDNTQNLVITQEEYDNFQALKNATELPFEKYDIEFSKYEKGFRYAIALFSDAHIEETVNSASVLGKNEYNIDIAEYRIKNYFKNLASCLNEDGVEELIFASLGDTISGFIHDELSQTNGLTPSEATIKAQSLIYSGLDFLCKNTKLNSIKFIGIVGNHSRTTKKIQHSNGYKLSYEWIMYQNIKNMCEITGLPVEFNIPESEIAVIDTPDNKRFLFVHGFQIKSTGSGTVCGIYPALNRLSMKWDRTFGQDKIYLGHFHTCVSIPNATVNGSIIGFNSFALSNGFTYEEPAQMYEVYDSERGLLLTRKIYCN